jgi:hypothetical protein
MVSFFAPRSDVKLHEEPPALDVEDVCDRMFAFGADPPSSDHSNLIVERHATSSHIPIKPRYQPRV